MNFETCGYIAKSLVLTDGVGTGSLRQLGDGVCWSHYSHAILQRLCLRIRSLPPRRHVASRGDSRHHRISSILTTNQNTSSMTCYTRCLTGVQDMASDDCHSSQPVQKGSLRELGSSIRLYLAGHHTRRKVNTMKQLFTNWRILLRSYN